MKQHLNRYTSLPIVLDMIWNNRIFLLDPSKWEDRNDAYFLAKYREIKELKSVLAICFSMSRERYHHWKVYSDGVAGACVKFDKDLLLREAKTDKNLRHGQVEYRSIEGLSKDPPSVDKLPFIKRLPYQDEREFRIIFESKSERLDTYPVTIRIDMIQEITLSPSIPDSTASTVIDIIHSKPELSSIRINRSTLLENERWKSIADDRQRFLAPGRK